MRRKALFCAIVSLAVSMAAGRGALAGGFMIYEHSALASGMASARTALWDDPSSMFFNPAAITQLPGIQLSLGDTLLIPSVRYEPLPESERTDQYDGTKAEDGEFEVFYPMHLYFTAKVTRWLSAGISVNNPFGLGMFWPEDWEGRFTAWQVNLRTFFIQPVLAVDFARMARLPEDVSISLAFGGDVVYGDALIQQKVDLSYLGAREVTMKMEGKGWSGGYNFSLFAAWKPWFSVGASARSNVPLRFSGTAEFKDFDPPEAEQMLAPLKLFPASTGGSTKMDLPWNMNVGLAFHGLKNFTFAVDLYVVWWESYDTLRIDFECSRTGTCSTQLNADAVYPKKWKKGYQFSFGTEYRPIKPVAVRLGFGYVTDPSNPAYYDAMLPDGDRYLLCIGLGYRAPKVFKIDLGYMFAAWRGEKKNDIGKPSSSGPNGRVNGTYTTLGHLVALSIGLSFGAPKDGGVKPKVGPPTTLDD